MSVTITPPAAAYTKRASVASATLVACIDQIEATLVTSRDKGNHARVEAALVELQKIADLLKDIHL